MGVRRFQWEDADGRGTGILRKIQIEAHDTQHEIQGCLLKSGKGQLGLAAFSHRDDAMPQVEIRLNALDVRKLAYSLYQFADILDAYERWVQP